MSLKNKGKLPNHCLISAGFGSFLCNIFSKGCFDTAPGFVGSTDKIIQFKWRCFIKTIPWHISPVLSVNLIIRHTEYGDFYMKYIVITKRHIIAALIVITLLSAIASAAALFFRFRTHAAEVFSDLEPEERILDSVLPSEKDGILEKLQAWIEDLGPEDIIEGSSGIFGAPPEPTSESSGESEPGNSSAETAAPTATPSEAPAPAPTPEQEPIKVEEKTITGKMELKNNTDFSVDLASLSNQPLPFSAPGSGEPFVLIVHTHTTESYGSGSRSTNENQNMIAIGSIIANQLNDRQIPTIHNTTVHDYPSYNKAYTRALSTIKSELSKHPSIRVVLDVHRDAIVKEDGTHISVSSVVNGEKTAQAMIVAGTNGTGLSHSGWKSNLIFGAKIQKAANAAYPGLMRPLNLREERFNQHMTPGSLILEIGSSGNSLEEAKRCASMIGDAIACVLTEN